MRRTLSATAITGVAVLGLGVLPASTALASTGGHHIAMAKPAGAKAPATYKISNAHCAATKITFNARQQENGVSGVQQFKQKAQLQEYVGRWVNRSGVDQVKSNKFPNNSRSYFFTRKWTGSHVNNGDSWRVKWQGLYLNGNGATIYHTPVLYVTC